MKTPAIIATGLSLLAFFVLAGFGLHYNYAMSKREHSDARAYDSHGFKDWMDMSPAGRCITAQQAMAQPGQLTGGVCSSNNVFYSNYQTYLFKRDGKDFNYDGVDSNY